MTLSHARELAMRLNPRLQTMIERVEQARAGQAVAFADFLPSAVTSIRHIAGDTNLAGFALPTIPSAVGNLAYGTPAERFDIAELNVQWLIWDFGRTPGRYGQAVNAAEIARLQYDRARQSVAFDVTNNYLTVLAARAQRIIAEEALVRADSHLRDARNFLEKGTAVRNDVLRAELQVADMRLGLVKARTAEATAIAALNQSIGINVNTPTQLIGDPPMPAAPPLLSECLQLAVAGRDEFRVVQRVIESAQLDVGVHRAEFLPKIFVGGTGASMDTSRETNADLIAGGVNIQLHLFEGGKRVASLRQARAGVRAAVASGREICDRIAFEVTTTYLAIEDARRRIDVTNSAVSYARENLRIVDKMFQQGDATPTEVVDAELTLTRAQQNQAAALYDYQIAIARLEFAVGRRVEDKVMPPEY